MIGVILFQPVLPSCFNFINRSIRADAKDFIPFPAFGAARLFRFGRCIRKRGIAGTVIFIVS